MQKLKKTMQQQQKQQKTFENNNKNKKYNSSSRNPKDIYSRSSGGLEDVLYLCCCLCFSRKCFVVLLCLLFLPSLFGAFACTSEQNYSNNNKTPSRKTIKTNIQLIQPEPERYLFAVEWWAGCPVFVCVVLLICLESLFVYLFIFCLFCFCLVVLSFCLDKTQYTTLNANKHKLCLFMTCVQCPKTPKYQSSNTTHNKTTCVRVFVHNCIQVRSFRLHAMTICRLQGGQKAGGIGHHPYIYIYIYTIVYHSIS